MECLVWLKYFEKERLCYQIICIVYIVMLDMLRIVERDRGRDRCEERKIDEQREKGRRDGGREKRWKGKRERWKEREIEGGIVRGRKGRLNGSSEEEKNKERKGKRKKMN